MQKKLAPINTLQNYLPQGSYDKVLDYLNLYKVQLTITKDRKSILGDYRTPLPFQNHRISINGGLNKYSFLITLIHELAHLVTFENYQRKVEPHGKEWQNLYALLLEEFVQLHIFPNDIVDAIKKTQKNPAASSCAEVHLTKALHNYDANVDGLQYIEKIKTGHAFSTPDGRIFEKGEKRRTRHFGKEIATGKLYLFSGIYRVKEIIG
jgi:SprT protein